MKKGVKDRMALPTLSYGYEIWTGNVVHSSRIQIIEMSFLWGACGVSRDGACNGEIYMEHVMVKYTEM